AIGKQIINRAYARDPFIGREAASHRTRNVANVRCRSYGGQSEATRRGALAVRETGWTRDRFIADVRTFRASHRRTRGAARPSPSWKKSCEARSSTSFKSTTQSWKAKPSSAFCRSRKNGAWLCS